MLNPPHVRGGSSQLPFFFFFLLTGFASIVQCVDTFHFLKLLNDTQTTIDQCRNGTQNSYHSDVWEGDTMEGGHFQQHTGDHDGPEGQRYPALA